MTDRTNRILCGDAREKLRELPEQSVQCVVTSPPYWGLRDYGTEPQVWGGSDKCAHEWGDKEPSHHPGQVEQTKWKKAEAAGKGQNAPSGAYCLKCNAWLGSLGLEPTPELYIEHMVVVFREVRRVLRKDGTLWLNMGDCYATSPPGNRPNTSKDSSGLPNSRENLEMRRAAQARNKCYGHLKPKDLIMMPHRLALALQADGWWVRMDNVWAKKNCMPESVRDRPTRSHEYVFLMTKRGRYFFDQEAVRERQGEWDHSQGLKGKHLLADKQCATSGQGFVTGCTMNPAGRNIRSVWTIPTQPFAEAHFATFPEEIPERCIKAGTSEKGCCPVCGAPWRRVVEKTKYTPPIVSADERFVDKSRGDKTRKLSGAEYNKQVYHKTTGWRPSCSCPTAPPIPCTVLDPFVGSGTTAIVAKRLGRTAIGIELSKQYAIMARQQLSITRLGDARRPKKVKVQRKRLRVRRVRSTKGINGK